jgi:predicted small lipoprotein YifL
MRALLVLMTLAAVAGCWLRPSVPVPPVPPVAAAPEDAAALRAHRDRLLAELAGVQAQLRSAEREATLAPLRALCTWATWIGGAVALLGVVGLILLRVGAPWLPVGGRFLLAVVASGVGLSAAALGLGQALPWLGPIGLGLLILLVVGGLAWAALTWRRGGRAAAQEWKRYANHLPEEVRQRLDAVSLAVQGRDRAVVDRLLGGA